MPEEKKLPFKEIKKRDGRVVDFEPSKIKEAIYKAITATGQGNGKESKKLSQKVITLLKRRFKKGEIPTVEQVQDIVEEVLILAGLVKTAKAYILYREQRRRIREEKQVREEAVDRVDDYLQQLDWEVKENANMAFSLQGLNRYTVSYVVKKYWLNKIYPPEIRKANEQGLFHIHDLDTLGCYCMGWDLFDFLIKGFGGVKGKVESKPAKHLRSALGQAVNFLYTLQGEAAGAVAFSNFDTLMAPFIRYDGLSYKQVKQTVQEFLYNMAIPTRVGFQSPFSNITLDLKPSGVFADKPVIIGGQVQKETYGDFKEEMRMFDRAFYEVMLEGDKTGRPFHFPIPTINITKDFPWDDPAFDIIFEASAKYGTNYFANYINSDMSPDDARSMCFPATTRVIYKTRKKGIPRRSSIRHIVNRWEPDKNFYLLINGEWVKITDAFKLENTTGKIVKVRLKNGETLRMTPDHPAMIVKDGALSQVSAKKLRKGDVIPIAKGGYKGKLGDFDLGRWLGLYVAEGGTTESTVYFSFHEKEKNLISFVREIAEQRFAFPTRVTIDPRWQTCQVWVKSRAAVEWVKNFCQGENALEKRLSSACFGMSDHFRQGVIVGIYQGDGYERDMEFHTTNRKLRNDVAELAQSIGMNYTKRTNTKNSKEGRQFASYILRLCKDSLEQIAPYFKNIKVSASSLFKDFGDFSGIKIDSIEVQNYHSSVYDFEVDSKEHLFQLANGVITHNCCRLRLDLSQLHNRGGGGLFGSGSLTGCYDEKTEVLTEDGWKRFEKLTREDRIFTLADDNKIELHHPVRFFKYDYQGKMIRFKAKSFDLLVTPNHRMVVDRKHNNERMFVEAKDFKPYQHFIPKGGIWQGKEEEYFVLPPVLILGGAGPESSFSEEALEKIQQLKKGGESIYQIAEHFRCNAVTIHNVVTKENYGNRERLMVRCEAPPMKIKMDDWLRFFGFWLAEGSTDNENIALDHGYRVTITQIKQSTRQEIKTVLDALPFNYYEEGADLIIYSKQLWSYLRQFGNKYTKFIPKELKNLSQRQLKILFSWMVKGDGHIRETTGQINYWTSSKKLADDLQEIILKLGWMGALSIREPRASRIKERKIKSHILYQLGVQKTKHYSFAHKESIKRNIKEVDYTGKVYCCEVPNHTMFVRRNGKATWCGNSIGVVTVNLPRIAYTSKTRKQFFSKLTRAMDLAKESLEIKRKVLENYIEKGLYPYSKFYLRGVKQSKGAYYANHFSTIGLIGMNEALLNFLSEDIGSKIGLKFALQVMDFMRKRLLRYQKETGQMYNLEASPAEGSLAPQEKVLIAQSDPRLAEIGPLIDEYIEKNKNQIKMIGNSEVLPLAKDEMFTYGFSRRTQKINKYPVTALVRHPGESMYEIVTVSGRKVRVTGQHSVFNFSSEGSVQEIRVSDLKEKEIIAIPKKIEMEEQYSEFNLIEEFRQNHYLKDKLYLKTTSQVIENLIDNDKVKKWAGDYYGTAWKDVKCWWRKKRTVPLKIVYDLDLFFNREESENSLISYRKGKSTYPIKALINCHRNLGLLFGLLLAEGWVDTDRMEITNTDLNLLKTASLACQQVFGNKSCYLSKGKERKGREKLYTLVLNKMTTLAIKEFSNITGKGHQKSIPSFAYFASKDFVAGLLKGFCLGDGSGYFNQEKSDYTYRLYTSSKELMEGLNILLLRIGILAKIRTEQRNKDKPNWRKSYVLSISGADNLNKFYTLVFEKGFKIKLNNSGREVIPKIKETVKFLVKKHGLNTRILKKLGIDKDSFNRNVRKNRVSLHYLRNILAKLGERIQDPLLNKLKLIARSDLYWDAIKSVKKVKTPKYVYDLEVDVEGDLVNNFLGGQGLVSLHNTSYRLARKDKEEFPDIITAGTKDKPYYTNSTQLPVNYTDDVFKALELQDELQTKYTGGCIERGNKVLTDKGLIKIEDIVNNFQKLKPLKVLSYNKKERKSEWDSVVQAVSVGVKKHNKIRIKAERGLDITTSDWHPFFVLEEIKQNGLCPVCKKKFKNTKALASHLRWSKLCREKYKDLPKYQVKEKRADELKKRDYILQNSSNLYPEKRSKLNDDLMWLFGFFIGDGSISEFIDNRGGNHLRRYKLCFYSEHQDALKKVVRILNHYFGCNVSVIHNEKRSDVLREVSTSKEEAIKFFFNYGFPCGEKCYTINVPQKVKENITENNVYALLSGLMDSDGHIDKKQGDFEYYTVSPKLADDILEICTCAGILVSKIKKPALRKNEKDIYRLRVPKCEMTKIKDVLTNKVNKARIKDDLSNRKKRYLPVVRVREVSKVGLEDEQFYDLMTENNHNYLAGKNTLVFIHNTVLHLFLGERLPDAQSAKKLVKTIFEQFKLPYISLTPTFSVCPKHGYLSGEHFTCPKCVVKQPCEVYSRVVGYYRPVQQWNKGKQQEFKERKVYKT